jgi:4-hydroxy-tetrahydrodipicolinate synthase
MITPFRDGEVDETALRGLVQFHLKNGTDGLVPCGTTGESVTMSEEELLRVVEIVVDEVNGRIPVIAGTGTNSTTKSIKLTKAVQKLGADGALLVTPYYNKPTQQGLFLHYEAIAKATDLPLVLYNVPGRTSVNMLPETVARLARIPTIAGIKEASGNMDQVSQIVQSCHAEFAVLSGDDSLTLPLLALILQHKMPGCRVTKQDAFRGERNRRRVLRYFRSNSERERKVGRRAFLLSSSV